MPYILGYASQSHPDKRVDESYSADRILLLACHRVYLMPCPHFPTLNPCSPSTSTLRVLPPPEAASSICKGPKPCHGTKIPKVCSLAGPSPLTLRTLAIANKRAS